MNMWEIKYRTENGFSGSVVVHAVNRFAAWEFFKAVSAEFDSKVCEADCSKLEIEDVA